MLKFIKNIFKKKENNNYYVYIIGKKDIVHLD